MNETMQEGTVNAGTAQRATTASRLEGLAGTAARYLQQAARHLDAGQHEPAGRALQAALALAPNHPEVARLQGVFFCRTGRPQLALPVLQRACALWPDDALILGNLGAALSALGDNGGAIDAFRRATTLAPDQAPGWFNLGLALEREALHEEAGAALRRVLQLMPRHVPAHVAHAGNLATIGRVDDAAAEYRHVLAFAPNAVHAWLGLANLKTTRLDEAEVGLLESVYASGALGEEERGIAGFALGKALEDHARHDEAFAVFGAANAIRRRRAAWDARAFSRGVDDIAAAFAAAAPDHGGPGHEVIFIVGLPRSGSTLVEQIVSAHPQVEGASELPDLDLVIREESVRRNAPFTAWAGEATAQDWHRMGERYLERTARWRTRKPRHTDKMPDNWLIAGAALAMLPGARVIDCRRDPLETAWSCYKQWFGSGRQPWACDLADIAAQLRDHDRLMRIWQARFPHAIRLQSHEALLADAEREVRGLLDFCGLDFDPACLRFHQSTRAVRSASAAQVRQPLRGDTARARDYGALLAPLQRLLEDDDSPAGAFAATPSSGSPADTPAASPGTGTAHVASDPLPAIRLDGLAAEHRRGLTQAINALAQRRVDAAQGAIEAACAAHPDHPAAVRLLAALHGARGRHAEARALLLRTLDAQPHDPSLLDALGRIEAETGDLAAARRYFEQALGLDPRAPLTCYHLAGILVAEGEFDKARDLLVRALDLAPVFPSARVALADLLARDGDPVTAAREYRHVLREDPTSAAAWTGLVRVSHGALDRTGQAALASACTDPGLAESQRTGLGLAFGKVLESRGQCRQAFATLMAANAAKRRTLEWDGARFAAYCARIADAFATPPAAAADPDRGAGIVFLVGPPESGADTLERILAAHPDVAAGGELPDLAAVIADESQRRRRRFPDWVADADEADWRRLGLDYMERTQRVRRDRSHSTDRSATLGTLLGAAAAMLPGARFIDCQRDRLEACWACFREDHAERRYSFDLLELAACWREHERLMDLWRSQPGRRLHAHAAERLDDGPDVAIRSLLADAGLDFDVACARAHEHQRALLAALDARETGLRHRFGARDYGTLLDPLQRALAAHAATDEPGMRA